MQGALHTIQDNWDIEARCHEAFCREHRWCIKTNGARREGIFSPQNLPLVPSLFRLPPNNGPSYSAAANLLLMNFSLQPLVATSTETLPEQPQNFLVFTGSGQEPATGPAQSGAFHVPLPSSSSTKSSTRPRNTDHWLSERPENT